MLNQSEGIFRSLGWTSKEKGTHCTDNAWLEGEEEEQQSTPVRTFQWQKHVTFNCVVPLCDVVQALSVVTLQC